MSQSVKPDDTLAAEFALGLLRGQQRDDVTALAASDDAVRSQVESWQDHFTTLDGLNSADADIAPPLGQFEKILDRIDAAGLQIPGTRTQRGTHAAWKDVGPGIKSRILHVDRPNNRLSVLIRMVPGAVYNSHSHGIDEETLVIEGDWNIGGLELKAGDYHVASTQARHGEGRTVAGCLIHVIMSIS